jgi:hypothetical protein
VLAEKTEVLAEKTEVLAEKAGVLAEKAGVLAEKAGAGAEAGATDCLGAVLCILQTNFPRFLETVSSEDTWLARTGRPCLFTCPHSVKLQKTSRRSRS